MYVLWVSDTHPQAASFFRTRGKKDRYSRIRVQFSFKPFSYPVDEDIFGDHSFIQGRGLYLPEMAFHMKACHFGRCPRGFTSHSSVPRFSCWNQMREGRTTPHTNERSHQAKKLFYCLCEQLAIILKTELKDWKPFQTVAPGSMSASVGNSLCSAHTVSSRAPIGHDR